MSSELGVSSALRHAIVPPLALTIESLPQEVLNQIFRRLSLRDLQAAACVSRSMNCSVIAAAHFHEFHSLRNFIKSLMQKLPEQRERLAKIAQNINFQNVANLQLLKRSILDVKAQLIGLIKTVDEEKVNDLHDVRPPHFLEHIFTLAALERQIDAAHLIPNEYTRGDALGDISKALAAAGDIDRSVEVATSILEGGTRGNTLWDISKALKEAGNIDRSLLVATLISDENRRGYALRDISQTLARAGDIERSLAVAWLIPDDRTRGGVFQNISHALTQAGKIETSLAFATSIPDEEMKGIVLWEISQTLKEAGNFDKATAVAWLIPNDHVRGLALRDISSLQ